MGLVVINGLIIVALAVSGLRRLVFDAVPMQLKMAITAGIGLFILFIGLVDAGFISATGVPSPPVGSRRRRKRVPSPPSRRWSSSSPCCCTGVLVARRVRGGILIGLVAGTVVAVIIEAIWHLGRPCEQPGRLEAVGTDVDRITVRAARTCRCSATSA